MIYQADTTLVPGRVSMRLVPVEGLPEAAERSFYVGNKSISIMGRNGESPNDSIEYEDLTIKYHDKLKIRPKILKRWVTYSDYRMIVPALSDACSVPRIFIASIGKTVLWSD